MNGCCSDEGRVEEERKGGREGRTYYSTARESCLRSAPRGRAPSKRGIREEGWEGGTGREGGREARTSKPQQNRSLDRHHAEGARAREETQAVHHIYDFELKEEGEGGREGAFEEQLAVEHGPALFTEEGEVGWEEGRAGGRGGGRGGGV